MATTVAEVLTFEPATVNAGVPVSEAAQQMRATSSQTGLSAARLCGLPRRESGIRTVKIRRATGGMMRLSTPDPLGHDDDVLTRSETLDEDDMGVDPLEDGWDPAENWSAADRYGTTATEQATERPLGERLDEERPDVDIDPVPDRPVAVTPLEKLDESVDDEVLLGELAPGEGQVLVGDEVDHIGESTIGHGGHLVTEPDPPAADETS
jgi:hypothetical protein